MYHAPARYATQQSHLAVGRGERAFCWLVSSWPWQAAEAHIILSFSMEWHRGLLISGCEDRSVLRNENAGGQDQWKRKALFSLGIFSDYRPVRK